MKQKSCVLVFENGCHGFTKDGNGSCMRSDKTSRSYTAIQNKIFIFSRKANQCGDSLTQSIREAVKLVYRVFGRKRDTQGTVRCVAIQPEM